VTAPAPNRVQDLFIYYLAGRVADPAPLRGPGFLGNWEEDGFSFLFFSAPADGRVETVVAAEPRLSLIDRYAMPYDEWQGDGVVPFGVGGLFVAPPWSGAAAPPGTRRISLDPGVVFGTGTHPTTRECLAAIQEIFAMARAEQAHGDREAGDWVADPDLGSALEQAPDPVLDRVLDLGAGTGVLALAAALLGSRRVLAVDLNGLAAETARDNIRRNGLEDRVLSVRGRAEALVEPGADLLLANLHHEVMTRLIDSPGFLRCRWFILSGLFRSQAREVADRLAGLPVRLLDCRSADGVWHTLLGRAAGDVRSFPPAPRRAKGISSHGTGS
jgi:ribosomal protein L11 methyltransferase